jgi:hypothetical protein
VYDHRRVSPVDVKGEETMDNTTQPDDGKQKVTSSGSNSPKPPQKEPKPKKAQGGGKPAKHA